MEQQIRFCTSADGTRIGWAVFGDGPPLVWVPGWAAVGLDARMVRHGGGATTFEHMLPAGRMLVTYDQRGLGSSQHEVSEISLETQLADLQCVIERAQVESFDLLGHVDGATVAAVYAARQPERVRRLALVAPFGRGSDIGGLPSLQAFAALCRDNWRVARQALSSVVSPRGAGRRRLSREVSGDVAAMYIEFMASLDVRAELPQVQAPTIVLHHRRDRSVPYAAGQAAAATIPDCRFVTIQHEPYLSGEIATLVRRFLDGGHDESVHRAFEAASSRPAPDKVGLVTILFTDLVSSTALTQRLGDAKAQELVRAHNEIVRAALTSHGGSEIKHTGDGIMASFPTASGALECAVAIQCAVSERAETDLAVHIGVNAGEPIAEEQDLFGTSVQLARRICDQAEAGQVLVSNVVRELAAGKEFLFADRGDVALRGFEDPVRLYELRWRA